MVDLLLCFYRLTSNWLSWTVPHLLLISRHQIQYGQPSCENISIRKHNKQLQDVSCEVILWMMIGTTLLQWYQYVPIQLTIVGYQAFVENLLLNHLLMHQIYLFQDSSSSLLFPCGCYWTYVYLSHSILVPFYMILQHVILQLITRFEVFHNKFRIMMDINTVIRVNKHVRTVRVTFIIDCRIHRITCNSNGWMNNLVLWLLYKLSNNHSVRQSRHKRCVEGIQTVNFGTLQIFYLDGKFMVDMGNVIHCIRQGVYEVDV